VVIVFNLEQSFLSERIQLLYDYLLLNFTVFFMIIYENIEMTLSFYFIDKIFR